MMIRTFGHIELSKPLLDSLEHQRALDRELLSISASATEKVAERALKRLND